MQKPTRPKRRPSNNPVPGLMLQHHPFKSRPARSRKPLKAISLSQTRQLLLRIAEQELALALAKPKRI